MVRGLPGHSSLRDMGEPGSLDWGNTPRNRPRYPRTSGVCLPGRAMDGGFRQRGKEVGPGQDGRSLGRRRCSLPAHLAPSGPLKDALSDDLEVRFRQQAMNLLCIAGLAGLPQVSLPLATLDGLPLGLSLVGRRGADRRLLALAEALMPEA